MLILASLSGIQGFLFDVRQSGGGQARSLRYRSFRIQLLAECVALRLLNAAGLDRDRLVFCAAAKLAIDAGHLPREAIESVRAAGVGMARLLVQETQGRLRLSVVVQPSSDDFASDFERAERALRHARLRPFAPISGSRTWDAGQLVVPEPWSADGEAKRDAELGRDLVNARWLTITKPAGPRPREGGGLDVLGLKVHLLGNEPPASSTLLSCSNLAEPESAPAGVDRRLFHIRRLARHVPRDKHGDPIEFVDLAARSRGAPMLGVLKADADSLGATVASTLRTGGGAARLQTLSAALDRFLADTIEAEKRDPGQPWRSIYTIFSGGDDLLAVGPWDVMLDFAGHMRRLFDASFGRAWQRRLTSVPLTISGGIALIKPRYPVHLATQQAEELLDQAKTEPAPLAASSRDQCAALGQVWKWTDHHRVISAGKRLADWVDAGVIQRGWLHTLLELALLRRGQAGTERADVPLATASSRLAYHVSRNWPRQDANNESARAARQWIDSVLDHFDAEPTGAPVEVRYLPFAVRYAMLATRGHREEG